MRWFVLALLVLIFTGCDTKGATMGPEPDIAYAAPTKAVHQDVLVEKIPYTYETPMYPCNFIGPIPQGFKRDCAETEDSDCTLCAPKFTPVLASDGDGSVVKSQLGDPTDTDWAKDPDIGDQVGDPTADD